MDILQRACAYLGEDPQNVVSHRVYADHIALVVDHGIHGSPKFCVLLADIPEDEPDQPPERPTKRPRRTRKEE
jgi:hypothetical protein